MSTDDECIINIKFEDLSEEEDPLYEAEIDIDSYQCTDIPNNDSLAKDLAEIQEMFSQILENEIKIQRDVSSLKLQRIKINDAPPVEFVNKNPNQYFSSANREFDLSKMNLPCSSLEDVHVLEKELADNLFFEIFFKNLLLEIECYDLTSFIKSGMQSIVNDDVTVHFSWHGLGENIEIRNLKFMQIFFEICSIKFNQTEKFTIKKALQKYLTLVKEKVRRNTRGEQNDSFWSN